MKIIKPGYIIETPIDGKRILQDLERAGRTCYKSEDKITPTSAISFVRNIVRNRHESVMEHHVITVRFTIDTGVSHQLVRHRLASYSQESTKYCNYSKGKFDNQVTFILPFWLEEFTAECIGDETVYKSADTATDIWLRSMQMAESTYFALLKLGWSPEKARNVLPKGLKTEVVMTANLREWRAIFKQRTAAKAHPQIREVMVPLLKDFRAQIPEVFENLEGPADKLKKLLSHIVERLQVYKFVPGIDSILDEVGKEVSKAA